MNERTRLLPASSPSSSRPLLTATNVGGHRVNFQEESDTSSMGASSESLASDMAVVPPAAAAAGRITARQWITLGVLLVATLTSSFAVCLFPPFFPKIAEEKGCSASVYGFIIGTNCLATFLVTPFIGKQLGTIGLRFALIGGMFVGGVCCLLSGFLEFFTPGWEFVVLAILLRVVHATGNAMVITATFSYSAMEFGNNVGKVFSLTRTAMNLAQLFGPSIGGAIYGAGGFYLPFVVMGAVQIVMSFLSIPFLPETKIKNSSGSRRDKHKVVSILNMLIIPSIWISFLTFIVATACNGFLSINLEPKVLRRFELSPFFVGLLFGLKDGANCIASPIWGILCDRNRKTTVKPFIIVSAILAATSFFLLGASSVVGAHLTLTIPLVVVALSINGIGIGGEQVAGVMDALHEVVGAGYPDDPSMHGLIAGLWSSLSGFGRFVSRAGSGFLVDHIGFDNTAAVAVFLQVAVASITLVYMIFYEILLKKTKAVCLEDITFIEDQMVFTEKHSPSDSVMGRSVYVEVPFSRRSGRRTRASAARSLPQVHRKSHQKEQLADSAHITRSVWGSSSLY